MTGHYDGNLEFLNFLADISDPGTGEIRLEQLAGWLNLSPDEVVRRWRRSGRIEWADFANDVLQVLDCMHDRTHKLAQTIAWYRQSPVAIGWHETADELVAAGRGREALAALAGRTTAERPVVRAEVKGATKDRRMRS